MKVIKPQIQHVEEFKALYSKLFIDETKKTSRFFFDTFFEINHALALIDDNDNLIGGILKDKTIKIKLNNQIKNVPFLIGLFIKPEFQKKGYSRILLDFFEKKHQDKDILFLQAYNYDFYAKKYNYKNFYFLNQVLLISPIEDVAKRDELKFNPSRILKIYNEYVKKFNGYKIRTISDIKKLFKFYEVYNYNLKLTNKAYIVFIEKEVLEFGYVCSKDLLFLLKKYEIKIINAPLNERLTFLQNFKIISKNKNMAYKLQNNFNISEKNSLFISEEL